MVSVVGGVVVIVVEKAVLVIMADGDTTIANIKRSAVHET